jgi:hypothetical protein
MRIMIKVRASNCVRKRASACWCGCPRVHIMCGECVNVLQGGVWKNTEDEILKAAVMKYGTFAVLYD